jgi:hypothetical protein
MKLNGKFETLQEAFDFCRQCDRPVIVQVEGKQYRLFPSGKAEELTKTKGNYIANSHMKTKDL